MTVVTWHAKNDRAAALTFLVTMSGQVELVDLYQDLQLFCTSRVVDLVELMDLYQEPPAFLPATSWWT